VLILAGVCVGISGSAGAAPGRSGR
jgi:hypothetical protein